MNEKRNNKVKYFSEKTGKEESYATLISLIGTLDTRARKIGAPSLILAVQKLYRMAVTNSPTKKTLRSLASQYDVLCARIAEFERMNNQK